MFSFTCFNPHGGYSFPLKLTQNNLLKDPHDPGVGLINGDLVIPGNLLRNDVFDPVVDQVKQNYHIPKTLLI